MEILNLQSPIPFVLHDLVFTLKLHQIDTKCVLFYTFATLLNHENGEKTVAHG